MPWGTENIMLWRASLNSRLKFAQLLRIVPPMSDVPEKKAPKAPSKAEEKQARLAEALRANLRRRKSQAQDRSKAPDAGDDS